MSKITDAIRKVAESDTSKAPARTRDSAGNTVATLALQVNDATDVVEESALRNDAIVAINNKRLIDAGLLAPLDQKRHIANQYRNIKRPLLNNASGQGAVTGEDANLIMVTSALPGDGKTFNSLNLAFSMASEKDKSVLLVDADVAKPHISRLLSLEDEPGLIDLLTDESLEIGDVLLKTNIDGLRVLPAGRYDANATELLASRRMAGVVKELSTRFPDRIVIFDSPPLLITSESRVLASQMGQIVMVVCSGRTPQHAVIGAVESLDENKAISLILNQSNSGYGDVNYGAGYDGYY